MVSQENSIKHLEKSYAYPSILFQKLQRKEHFQTHSMRPPSLDTKTRQRQHTHTKKKLQANITDEHRCKNLQQNFSK